VPSLAILVLVVLVYRTDRITDADQRYTHATNVGVSNSSYNNSFVFSSTLKYTLNASGFYGTNL